MNKDFKLEQYVVLGGFVHVVESIWNDGAEYDLLRLMPKSMLYKIPGDLITAWDGRAYPTGKRD